MAAGMGIVLVSLIIIIPLFALFVYLLILAVRALRNTSRAAQREKRPRQSEPRWERSCGKTGCAVNCLRSLWRKRLASAGRRSANGKTGNRIRLPPIQSHWQSCTVCQRRSFWRGYKDILQLSSQKSAGAVVSDRRLCFFVF